MKKVAKKNLELDKEVIASLSENEMVGVTGGGNPNGRLIVDKDTRAVCTSHETGCGTRGVVCGGETGNCVPIPLSDACKTVEICAERPSTDLLATTDCTGTDTCYQKPTTLICNPDYTTVC